MSRESIESCGEVVSYTYTIIIGEAAPYDGCRFAVLVEEQTQHRVCSCIQTCDKVGTASAVR
jgi:hypothetical protein